MYSSTVCTYVFQFFQVYLLEQIQVFACGRLIYKSENTCLQCCEHLFTRLHVSAHTCNSICMKHQLVCT